MRRAANYVRVSIASKSKQSNAAIFVQNPQVQEERLRAMVKQLGWSLPRVYAGVPAGARKDGRASTRSWAMRDSDHGSTFAVFIELSERRDLGSGPLPRVRISRPMAYRPSWVLRASIHLGARVISKRGWMKLGIVHERIRAGRPQQNGRQLRDASHSEGGHDETACGFSSRIAEPL